MKGKVIFYTSIDGYGFIRDEEDEKVFIHFTDIIDPENDFKILNIGDEVKFDKIENEKGKRAINLEITQRMTIKERFKDKAYIRWSFSKENNPKKQEIGEDGFQKTIYDF
ncbi:MAG: hypothetical protein GF311_22845 [Candidatus Lokiarchaeota archaeon]|nr:hypothetical protein [Candidatus Lokiarchaeota archaeon]